MNLEIKSIVNNEDIFLSYLDQLTNTYTYKKLDWIHTLKKEYDRYLHWSLCFNNDKIVAFSCIQKHVFDDDTVRILTRTWFDNSIRCNNGSLWRETPVAPMAKDQIDWLKGTQFRRAIFTLEPHRGYDLLKFLSKKINQRAGTNFVPKKDKIKTWRTSPIESYQLYAEHLL